MRRVGRSSTPQTGLQRIGQTYQRRHGPPQQAEHQDSADSSKLSMLDTGNERENSPVKPALPDPPETSQTTNPIPPNQITSLANPSPSRRTTTPALPRARAPLLTRRSPLLTFPRNSGKTVS